MINSFSCAITGRILAAFSNVSMDRQSDKNEIYKSNGFDLNSVLNNSSNVKRKVARKRWAILAKALKSPTGSEPSSPTDEFSVRRISSFMLLTTQQLQTVIFKSPDKNLINLAKNRTWYKYSMMISGVELFVVVGHRLRTFSAEDLMGFNNTGNICIWPSEETLTFYIGSNLELVKNKSVLELGGGMSCLAGLFCAKYGASKYVLLTDGNKISVENVDVSLNCNEFTCPVSCQVLKWGQCDLQTKFDIILCADCLFFDEARADLIDTLWNLLNVNGVALVMAPKRGNTLTNFINQSHIKGFSCKEMINYNNIVWEKHLMLLQNCDYDDNIHYPILIEMTKDKADYWKSQTRKYCEFCRCWIADNKPSVEFHEKGRRHKENVAKKLKHITKKSRQNEISSIKVEAAIAQMESAAMEAYQRDVQCNADLTSIAINKKIGVVKKLWKEAESDTGQKYYYNTITQETVWTPPKEGFLKIGEDQDEDFRKQWKEYHKKQLLNENLKNEEARQQAEEERARQEREKLKALRVEVIPEPAPAPLIPEGRTNPYGQWTTVEIRPVEETHFEAEEDHDEKPPLPEEAPVKVFKEKTFESLGEASGSTTFKKRKFLSGNKKNARARLDED